MVNEEEPFQARTAFLVFIDKEGGVAYSPNINEPVVTEKIASAEEIISAAHLLVDKFNAQMVVNSMQNMMMATAKKAAEHAQTKQEYERIKNGLITPRGR